MAKPTLRQQKTIGRVMHEYAHGELKSGAGGAGGKVKSRKQAIAIALSESGASNRKTSSENRRSKSRTTKKEARGKTAQQEHEGKSHVGARDQRQSSQAMGGKNATRRTAAAKKAAATRARAGSRTKAELYNAAKKKGVAGRSKMSMQQLRNAVAK